MVHAGREFLVDAGRASGGDRFPAGGAGKGSGQSRRAVRYDQRPACCVGISKAELTCHVGKKSQTLLRMICRRAGGQAHAQRPCDDPDVVVSASRADLTPTERFPPSRDERVVPRWWCSDCTKFRSVFHPSRKCVFLLIDFPLKCRPVATREVGPRTP